MLKIVETNKQIFLNTKLRSMNNPLAQSPAKQRTSHEKHHPSADASLNYLLIAIYVIAFWGIVLLILGAVPMVGGMLFELENAAARMLH